ncbi:MAG TPA: lipid-binding SYLF domain-containing protein [Candidatus Eisenbacteria bacterium]|nr:lipid-binding SYLF domain-containing protein [Candidatus Eisenbacteria bacterium]HVN07757.1 lipid-binding SYLF domain-containing protein [Patescibacteria group bacterium]
MNRKLLVIAACLAMASPMFAQNKEDERLEKSATVLQEILSSDKGLSKHILDESRCVLIFPSVKKVAVGFGQSYGRGALICRKGEKMDGAWGSPAMYALDQSGLGIQLGSTATDFVLVVMRENGVEQILNGKTKLGGNAAAAAGPSGAQAEGYNAAEMTADVLTYSRTKGAFAGVSLNGASMDSDNDANKRVYGKTIDAKTIISSNPTPPAAAKSLQGLLDKTSPHRK